VFLQGALKIRENIEDISNRMILYEATSKTRMGESPLLS